MTFTTASGTTFTCGDGTGEPVSVRFLTKASRTQHSARSRTGPWRSLYGRHIRRRAGLDRRRPGDPPRSARYGAALGGCDGGCATSSGTSSSSIRAAVQKQRRPSLRPRRSALFALPRRRQQYSCAYFETPDTTLDDAQLAKKRHLAAKLLIGRGDRVLDIGSGWGGLGLYLAEMTGADVTGMTLSTEQFQVSNARAAERT